MVDMGAPPLNCRAARETELNCQSEDANSYRRSKRHSGKGEPHFLLPRRSNARAVSRVPDFARKGSSAVVHRIVPSRRCMWIRQKREPRPSTPRLKEKFWHGDPGRAQLKFLDSLRYRGFKVSHRTDNHSRWASLLVATAAESRLNIHVVSRLRKFQRTELCRSKGSPGSDRGFKDSSCSSLRDRALKRCNIIQSENRHKPPSKKHRSSSKKMQTAIPF
jgi:hypothetical protein